MKVTFTSFLHKKGAGMAIQLLSPAFQHALDFVLARLDGPQELEHIILVGGGAYLYTKAVRRRFPKHKITEVADPMYANVRGFQLLGEQYVRERPELFRADGGSVTSEASVSAGSQ